MPPPLPVPYQPQIADGYCLAACAQMVLAYWGLPANQEGLAVRLGVILGVGIPAGRITRLASGQLTAVYDTGDWETAAGWLDREVPVIVMVQLTNLFWPGASWIFVMRCYIPRKLDFQAKFLTAFDGERRPFPAFAPNPPPAPHARAGC